MQSSHTGSNGEQHHSFHQPNPAKQSAFQPSSREDTGTHRRTPSSCSVCAWLTRQLCPCFARDASTLSAANSYALPRHVGRKPRGLSLSQSTRTESKIMILIAINLIFMSILHIYMYFRSDVASGLLDPDQKEILLSSSIAMANSTRAFMWDGNPPETRTERTSSRGQAIQQAELNLRLSSSSSASASSSQHANRTVSLHLVSLNATQRSQEDATSAKQLLANASTAADASINGASHQGPLLSLSVTASEPKNALQHQKTRKKHSGPEETPDSEIWKQPCVPQQQTSITERRLQNQHRIIFSPHYDDAVLSLGGMLSVDPANTTVITVFAGKPPTRILTGYDMQCNFSDSHKALDARSAENKKSLGYLGVAFRNMDYIDHQYAEASRSVYRIWRPSSTWLRGNATRVVSISDYFAEIRKNRRNDLRVRLAADIEKILNDYQQDGTHVEVYSSLGRAAALSRVGPP
jgi:hypothetical protein